MFLAVGLGNPGTRFERTRHNAGFRVVDILAERLGVPWKSEDRFSWARGMVGEKTLYLLKPLTFMNLSGEGLLAFFAHHGCTFEELIVVHDELDFPPGVVRIKVGGGVAGHRGLQSIVEALGREDFVRVRVGIGKPERRELVVDHVLGVPEKEESAILEAAEKKAAEAVLCIVEWGVQRAMNVFNAREEDGQKEAC
ncbi:aminoacyl-tRNA hydrolase [Candidatus Caldatribacterium sp. SIUC1]|uniref:aminoacyl-tRNA hydrolase n=1 Tax=Candidatus Caldatribacterium sp. SIUC1 TaxID=3418365 RepID=UPI003F692274